MIRRFMVASILTAGLTLSCNTARASDLFYALLDGAQEVPAKVTPATGWGSVLLNPAGTMITVDMCWQNLLAVPSASHIHAPAPPGVNAGVRFPLVIAGKGTTDCIATQTFAITPAQVADLRAGLSYFNIHNTINPGGEIRGQILATPEGSSIVMMMLGGLPIAGLLWKRSKRRV